jgi:hypothetical protein
MFGDGGVFLFDPGNHLLLVVGAASGTLWCETVPTQPFADVLLGHCETGDHPEQLDDQGLGP